MIMKNDYQQVLNEIFEDEIYDMCDDISQDAICKVVTCAADQFGRGARTVLFTLSGYFFKVVNCRKGFVSCSNNESTGVSHTLYKPFPNDGEHEQKECFKNLIDMMNEAWYHCNN